MSFILYTAEQILFFHVLTWLNDNKLNWTRTELKLQEVSDLYQ